MKQKLALKLYTLTAALLIVAGTVQAQLGKSQGLIDTNTASEEQLNALPHFTEELTEQIVENRPFKNVVELNELLTKTLSEEELDEVYAKTFIHINLNSAPKEEMLLIPGVGDRMAHEFDEYRPYKALEQFRREIGKYVDDEEVARLEQYVFIPIDLNTASDEDILTIPGLGQRMLHEFKEYRPYTNIEQFRREIGKYVDDKVVSRYERYVTLEAASSDSDAATE